MTTFPVKPLGYVKEGLEKMGHDVSYVYDDLIFPTHTTYLIQFGKESYELDIFFNTECGIEDRNQLKEEITDVFAAEMGFSLSFPGSFELNQGDGEEIEITFNL